MLNYNIVTDLFLKSVYGRPSLLVHRKQADDYSAQLSSSSSSSYWNSIIVVVYLEANKKSHTAKIIGD